MKLEVAVTDLSPSQKEVTIEVPATEVKAEFEKAYDAYSKYAKVPGFRPGRVPRSVIRQRFAKELRGEVISQLVPHALSHAVVDQKLRMVGNPDIDHNALTVAEGEPLRFTAAIEVVPDFEITPYKGLKATRRVVKVTDEDIDKIIDYWRESSAEFVPVEDRSSQNGDFVSVNLSGKYLEPVGEHEEEGLKTDDVQIEIGGENVQNEFSENLTGVKVGDSREFRVVYPEDFQAKGLAGKTIDFTAEVIAVRRKELPPVDDELAKQFGQAENLAELREKLRDNMVTDSRNRAETQLRDELITDLLSTYNFEIPPKLLQREQERRSQEFIHRLINSRMPVEQMMNINVKQELDRVKRHVEREMRIAMVFQRISEAENIEASQDEVRAEAARRAAGSARSQEEMDQIMERLTNEESLSSIENSVIYDKTLDLIVSNAEINEEEITAEEAARLAETAESLTAAAESAGEETTAQEEIT